MKETAVEWLYKNLLENPISNQDIVYNESVFHNAKEMERNQRYTEEEVGELITKAIKRTSEYCNINKLYGDTIEQFSKEWFNENKKK